MPVERALDACLKDHGGFDHNDQALRVVTLAGTCRYPEFDGLNFGPLGNSCWSGIVKHKRPFDSIAR